MGKSIYKCQVHLIQVTGAANICTVQRRQNAPGRHIILSCHSAAASRVSLWLSCLSLEQAICAVGAMDITHLIFAWSVSLFLLSYHISCFSSSGSDGSTHIHKITSELQPFCLYNRIEKENNFEPSLITAHLLHAVRCMLCYRYSFFCLFVCLIKCIYVLTSEVNVSFNRGTSSTVLKSLND